MPGDLLCKHGQINWGLASEEAQQTPVQREGHKFAVSTHKGLEGPLWCYDTEDANPSSGFEAHLPCW